MMDSQGSSKSLCEPNASMGLEMECLELVSELPQESSNLLARRETHLRPEPKAVMQPSCFLALLQPHLTRFSFEKFA